MVDSALAIEKHPILVDYSSFLLLYKDVLSVVRIFFACVLLFLDSRMHLVSPADVAEWLDRRLK